MTCPYKLECDKESFKLDIRLCNGKAHYWNDHVRVIGYASCGVFNQKEFLMAINDGLNDRST